MPDAPSESVGFVILSQGKFSTSSLATVPEMLAPEVTLDCGRSKPDTHHFYMSQVNKLGVVEWAQTQENMF
jgi:hypothetical protein